METDITITISLDSGPLLTTQHEHRGPVHFIHKMASPPPSIQMSLGMQPKTMTGEQALQWQLSLGL